MTLGKLILFIFIIAVALTVAHGTFKNRQRNTNWLMTFLQQFSGALFVFSGWVKAVDPMGTAFKMEQYFAEFESTFSETWLSFIAPLFPAIAEYSILFSVGMIVLEIILGIALIFGSRSKITSWLFFLIVVFFTFLTGFTYLTGYVPDGVNFFEFGKWGDWVETSMKVTDCGCFGDFLVLAPKTSFFKDIVLLFPAFYFLFSKANGHQTANGLQQAIVVAIAGLASLGIILVNGYPVGLNAFIAVAALIAVQFLGRVAGIWGGTLIVLIYCLSNFVWDIPKADFRPFNIGKDVKERRAMEEEAENNVEIIAYKATNKSSGQIVEVPYAQYLKEFKKYPKEEWKLEQIKTEPAVKRTKVSDFDVSNAAGESVTEDILNNADYQFMIVAYKIDYDSEVAQREIKEKIITRLDTTFTTDNVAGLIDTVYTIDTIFEEKSRLISAETFTFPGDYTKPWKNTVNPLLAAAEAEGINSFAVTAYADPAMIDDFRHETQAAYPFYFADDITLKTVVRSNPGIVLWKEGKIIMKWHHKRVPSFEEIKANYIK